MTTSERAARFRAVFDELTTIATKTRREDVAAAAVRASAGLALLQLDELEGKEPK